MAFGYFALFSVVATVHLLLSLALTGEKELAREKETTWRSLKVTGRAKQVRFTWLVWRQLIARLAAEGELLAGSCACAKSESAVQLFGRAVAGRFVLAHLDWNARFTLVPEGWTRVR